LKLDAISPIQNIWHIINGRISQSHQINNAMEQVEKDFGRIDILINNSRFGLFDNAEKTTDEM
jgi:NAD(P)-dependent dehydrogenase (short-subunit alcohol dehydrogenase family)